MRWLVLGLMMVVGMGVCGAAGAQEGKGKRVVLIAGKKSHGPGEHEYEKGVKLLARCLETSPNLKGVRAEVVLDGWPEDAKVLEGADAILLFSDGADRDEKAHPLLAGDRLQQMQRLMEKGVGLCVLHYTVFVPTERGGKQFLEWVGGYFDYDSTGPGVKDPKKWYSKLGMAEPTSSVVTAGHPVARGVGTFKTRTEYYWNMRFREGDERVVPLLTFDPKAGRSAVVAWAVERKDGGRGFAFTGGHFHSDFGIESFRKLVLNAIVWTAKGEVPEGGVASVVAEGEFKR